MPFGLPETVIGDLRKILEARPEVTAAVLYGSRAKGNFRPGSDIDLVIKGDHVSLEVLNTISGRIEDFSWPWLVDLSAYNSIENPALISHIDRLGVVIYTRD